MDVDRWENIGEKRKLGEKVENVRGEKKGGRRKVREKGGRKKYREKRGGRRHVGEER